MKYISPCRRCGNRYGKLKKLTDRGVGRMYYVCDNTRRCEMEQIKRNLHKFDAR